MKRKTLAALGLLSAGLCAVAAVPAHAMEHRTVISHPEGPIAADYSGATRIELKQVGTAGPPGRGGELRCLWSVSLAVERSATAGARFQARRSMVRDGVLTGSTPGWCAGRTEAAERAIAARRDTLHQAMMAMVAQDRVAILAEAAAARYREG
jgi:hypothetical protein